MEQGEEVEAILNLKWIWVKLLPPQSLTMAHSELPEDEILTQTFGSWNNSLNKKYSGRSIEVGG
jgi:hypothetical protein